MTESRAFVLLEAGNDLLSVCRNALETVVLESGVVTEGASRQDRGFGGMSRRTAALIAWSMWATSLALTALSLLLLVLNLSPSAT